jgi:hypothetical protein
MRLGDDDEFPITLFETPASARSTRFLAVCADLWDIDFARVEEDVAYVLGVVLPALDYQASLEGGRSILRTLLRKHVKIPDREHGNALLDELLPSIWNHKGERRTVRSLAVQPLLDLEQILDVWYTVRESFPRLPEDFQRNGLRITHRTIPPLALGDRAADDIDHAVKDRYRERVLAAVAAYHSWKSRLGAAGDSVQSPQPASLANVFHVHGKKAHVRFDGEPIPTSTQIGNRYIAYLLRDQRPLSYSDLDLAVNGPTSSLHDGSFDEELIRQVNLPTFMADRGLPAADLETIRKVRAYRDEIALMLDSAKEDSNVERVENLQDEMNELNVYLNAVQDVHGNPRRTNDPAVKRKDRISTAVQRTIEKLGTPTTTPSDNLAKHLRACLKFESDAIEYVPDPRHKDWDVQID